MKSKSLLEVIEPQPNSKILIYDVHASESGALSILNDLYYQICNYPDKSIEWIFAVSVPTYQKCNNIKILRFPWVKKSWFHRLYFDMITTRKILKKYSPNKIFSLQNMGISYFKQEQYVYLHLPFILTDYRFRIKRDGKKLWLYQNVLKKKIFHSFKKVNKIIVQTEWMKQALIEKAHISSEKVIVNHPNIEMNIIGKYYPSNRIKFFYPATAFYYKNHMTLLKAIEYAANNGLEKYEVFLTIEANENRYTKELSKYAQKKNLNVIFNGPISREEVFKKYQDSILLFPSFVESFGLPLLEARKTGTPIVASRCPFSEEILERYPNVLFFNPLDSIEMGNAILKLLQNQVMGEKKI